MTWYFDITPIHTTLATYLAYHTDISKLHGNYTPLIEEVIQSQIYPYTDYPYGTIYEHLVSYGVDIEVAESISAYMFQALGHVFANSDLLEYTSEGECSVKIGSNGIAEIKVKPHMGKDDLTLQEQLIERELQAYENGDYIPPRQRLFR